MADVASGGMVSCTWRGVARCGLVCCVSGETIATRQRICSSRTAGSGRRGSTVTSGARSVAERHGEVGDVEGLGCNGIASCISGPGALNRWWEKQANGGCVMCGCIKRYGVVWCTKRDAACGVQGWHSLHAPIEQATEADAGASTHSLPVDSRHSAFKRS